MSTKFLSELIPESGWHSPEQINLKPLQDHELTPRKKLAFNLMLKIGKARCPNLFRTMFRNFRIYKAFARFNAKVMPKGELARRETELMILRVGWKTRSLYEWGQHVEIGMRIGLTSDDIVRVTQGADAQGWSEQERLLLTAVDEILDNKVVSDVTWKALSAFYNDKLMLEILFTITGYNGLATVLNSTGIRLEDDIQQVLTQTRYS